MKVPQIWLSPNFCQAQHKCSKLGQKDFLMLFFTLVIHIKALECTGCIIEIPSLGGFGARGPLSPLTVKNVYQMVIAKDGLIYDPKHISKSNFQSVSLSIGLNKQVIAFKPCRKEKKWVKTNF